METKALKDRINYLLDLANRASASKETDSGTVPRNRVNAELFAELRSGGLAFILKNFGEQHPFYKDYDGQVRTSAPLDVERARGILRAVKAEIES
jgi:hypothetical protein